LHKIVVAGREHAIQNSRIEKMSMLVAG
jgi:hypothetical protein